MTMYLVLSAFTSSPISLVAATKASVFFFTACTLPPNPKDIFLNEYFEVIRVVVDGLLSRKNP
jgi:hypothetical protein